MRRKKATKAAALVEWATANAARTNRACVTCSHEQVAEIIAEVVALRKAGQHTVSMPQLHRRLLEEFPDWEARVWVNMRDHINRCLGGWGGKF